MHETVNKSFTIGKYFVLCIVFVYIRFIRFILGVMIITIAQLHPAKPELRFCAGLKIVHGVSEVRNGDNLRQYTLEIRLNAFGSPVQIDSYIIFHDLFTRM